MTSFFSVPALAALTLACLGPSLGAPEAERRLGLALVNMYGSLLGLEGLPNSWAELLALYED